MRKSLYTPVLADSVNQSWSELSIACHEWKTSRCLSSGRSLLMVCYQQWTNDLQDTSPAHRPTLQMTWFVGLYSLPGHIQVVINDWCCRYSADGAVSRGGTVSLGIQHCDVHRCGADGEAVEGDLSATELVLHSRWYQIVAVDTPHCGRHRSLLRQRLGRNALGQNQMGWRQVGSTVFRLTQSKRTGDGADGGYLGVFAARFRAMLFDLGYT